MNKRASVQRWSLSHKALNSKSTVFLRCFLEYPYLYPLLKPEITSTSPELGLTTHVEVRSSPMRPSSESPTARYLKLRNGIGTSRVNSIHNLNPIILNGRKRGMEFYVPVGLADDVEAPLAAGEVVGDDRGAAAAG